MSANTQEIQQSVLPHYDFVVQGIQPYQNNWWKVETNKGTKWLHLDVDSTWIQKRYAITEQLAYVGYRRTPRYVRNRYGDPFVQIQNHYYTLIDEWEGRPAGWYDVDANLCGANLAHLHNALEQIIWPNEISLPNRYGTWQNRFQIAAQDLRAFTDANRESLLQRCVEGAEFAVTELKNLNYEQWCRQRPAPFPLCLGDYDFSNLRITPTGRVVTFEFDFIGYDTSLYDLGKTVLHFAQQDVTRMLPAFLDGYEYYRPLDPYQKRIILAYISFPHTPYRLVAGAGAREGIHLEEWQGLLRSALNTYETCLGVKEVLEWRGI